MDDIDRCCAVLLCDRDASGCGSRLLRAGEHLLRSRTRPDVLRPGRPELLRSGQQLLPEPLLQAQVLQDQVLQAQVLQAPLLPLELQQLLRSRSDVLRSGPDVRRSRDVRCSDLRRSRRELLQLV